MNLFTDNILTESTFRVREFIEGKPGYTEAAFPARAATISASAVGFTGLVTCWSYPAARTRSRSSALPYAVNAAAGVNPPRSGEASSPP